MAVRPNTSSRASADSAPKKTPLHATSHGRNPSSGSSATTSSTSSLAIASSLECPRLPLPVLRAAEMRVQALLVLALERNARIELGSRLDVPLRQIDVDLRLFPAHALDPLWRHQHLPARQPVARVDDHVADRPRLGVDEKVLDVADVAVGRLNVVAHHIARAPEIGIRVLPLPRRHLLLERRRRGRRDRQDRIGQLAPAIGTEPVVRIAVVLRECDLTLAVDRTIGVDRRAILDLLLGQRRPEPRGARHQPKGERRDQHAAAREPRPGVDDEIAHRPGSIVEIQILNAADVAVHRLDRDALEIADRSEHVVLLSSAPRPWRLATRRMSRVVTRALRHASLTSRAVFTSREPERTPARACAALPASRTSGRTADT